LRIEATFATRATWPKLVLGASPPTDTLQYVTSLFPFQISKPLPMLDRKVRRARSFAASSSDALKCSTRHTSLP
jgi:hypothetical protein